MPGFRLWLLTFIGFCLLHAAWTFATPYDGPPDEQEHVIRAAGIMRGEILPEPMTVGAVQTAPLSLQRGLCFPTQVFVAASCEAPPGGDETPAPRDTRAGRVNPVYYVVTGWPLAPWPNWTGILLSRLINGA